MDTTTRTANAAQEAVRSAYSSVRRALDADLAQAGEVLTRRDLGALAARVTKTLRALGTQLAVDVAFGVPAPRRGRLAAVLILIEQVAHELGRLPLEVEPEAALALDLTKPPGTPLPDPDEEHWKAVLDHEDEHTTGR